MPRIERTIAGRDLVFDNIRIGDARRMKKDYPDNADYNVAFIAASMRAGGMADATPEYVDREFPFFDGVFPALLGAAFEACGMKIEKPAEGEAQPAIAANQDPPAASTSATSTEA